MYLQANKKVKRSRSLRKQKEVSLSKTKEWGQAIDSEHLSEITEEELEVYIQLFQYFWIYVPNLISVLWTLNKTIF